MRIKETTGVLKYNIETRNNMLRKNLGKYSQIDVVLSPAIGEAYQQRELSLKNQTDGKSILDYTHDEESSYSQNISHRYFGNTSELNVYDVLSPTNDKLQKWGGKYENYLKYVSQVYGKELTTVNFVEKLLSNQDILYGLRDMEIGVVKNIDVPMALAGVVTTNINNFSGTDTELGLITNQMYATSLYAASQFNTSRKRYDATSEYPYITPSLYNYYGNNSANINRLGDMMRPDRITGRIKDDTGLENDLNPKNRTYWDNDENGTGGIYDESIIDTENPSVKYLKRQVNETIKHRINDIVSYQNRRNVYTPREAYMSKSGDSYTEHSEYNEHGEKIDDSASNDSIYEFKNDTVRVTEDGTNITKEYDEGDSQWGGDSTFLIKQENVDFETFEHYKEQGRNTLLAKTNTLFRRHKLETLIGRFHTSSEYNKKYENESFDTAKTEEFGKSKGRNLLKLNKTNTNGYSNPYCRVWTYHHQYDRLTKRIRPFKDDNDNIYSLNDLQKLNENFRSKGLNSSDGWDYLADKTVLSKKNGLVNIVPSKNDNVEIAKCMFSIENLAWKDVPHMAKYLSEEQRGPLGGRIMWFPPYDLRFNENVNVDWNSNSFIGRGEKVYTYTNTDRTATLDFTILIDHPAIINEVKDMTAKEGGVKEAVGKDKDVLRFFAGCGPLDNGKKKNTTKEVDKQKSEAASNEPEETLNEEKTRKLKFYVFFPNNYSGNYNDGEKYDKSDWQRDGKADSDWAEYLLKGQNIGIPKNGGNYCGYEMNGAALSFTGEGADNEYISTAEQTKNWEVFSEYKGTDKDQRKYYYRVDFDLRQKLKYYDNYFDSKCFNLNSDIANVKKYYEDADCSFVEFMVALMYHRIKDDYEIPSEYFPFAGDSYKYLFNKLLTINNYDYDAVDELITNIDDIISSGVVKQINPVGGATIQDKKNSSILAYRRSRCLGSYVKNMLGFEGEIDYSKLDDVEDLSNAKTVNSEAAKAQRYASVEIVFGSPESKDSNEVLDKGSNIVTEVKTGTTGADSSNADNTGDTQIVTATVATAKTRYETESEYFEKLAMTDPLYFKDLTAKYKYFDPAFHSLSPEGFNARLTFLHQCTRQGHTVSTADQNFAKTAGNLSFGRSPVCALRIGDFFYSKVLIQSMSISYENGNGMQWDLNPEGAGVQPMYAHVSLSLVILGGQTLDGPADRLQNAQTFNYYANTGAYDDRADRISIDNNGNLTYKDIFVPYEVKTGTTNSIESK